MENEALPTSSTGNISVSCKQECQLDWTSYGPSSYVNKQSRQFSYAYWLYVC